MSLVESDIQSWWEVPSIAHFCSLFRAAFNLLDFDIEDLEEALLTDGTEDSGSSLLRDLVVGLLQGILGNQDVSSYNYQMFLRRVLRQRWENAGLTNPFKDDIDFQFLPLRTKVDILHSLCDYRLDAEDVADLLKNLEADSLRIEPLGVDDKNSKYWYFYGTRLYREDVIILNNTKPNSGVGRKKKKSRKRIRQVDPPIPISPDNGHVLNFLGEQIENQQYIWQVVCYTQDDWVKITKKFEKSESERERELYKTLKEDFLPEIPRLFAEKERLQRKRLLDAVPRRVSTRIEKLRQQREEEEKSGGPTPPASPFNDKAHFISTETSCPDSNDLDKEKGETEADIVSTERSAADRSKVPKPVKAASPPPSISENDSDTGPESSPSWDSSPPQEDIPMDVLPVKTGRRTMNSLSTVEFPIALSPLRRKKRRRSEEYKRDEETYRKSLYTVLNKLKNMEEAYPFLEPVDEEFAPDYYQVVKQPMDLQSMEDKLDTGAYQQLDEFEHDFNLIVVNCKKYNGLDSDYSQMVNVLEKAFVKQVKRLAQKRPLSSDDESPPRTLQKASKPIVESNPVKTPLTRKTRHHNQQSGKENLEKHSAVRGKKSRKVKDPSPPPKSGGKEALSPLPVKATTKVVSSIREDEGDDEDEEREEDGEDEREDEEDEEGDEDSDYQRSCKKQPKSNSKYTKESRRSSVGRASRQTDSIPVAKEESTVSNSEGEEETVEDEDVEDFNLSRAERDRRRRTRHRMRLEKLLRQQELEELEEVTEATLKDLNKWLEDTPRFPEFSPSHSPFRMGVIEDYRIPEEENEKARYGSESGRYPNNLNGSSSSYQRRDRFSFMNRKGSRRPNKINGKFSIRDRRFPGSSFSHHRFMGGSYRKDKNIERLQPGKIKGNLINHCSQKDKTKLPNLHDGLISKDQNSGSDRDSPQPKLSMGAVLRVSDFSSAARYSTPTGTSVLKSLEMKDEPSKVTSNDINEKQPGEADRPSSSVKEETIDTNSDTSSKSHMKETAPPVDHVESDKVKDKVTEEIDVGSVSKDDKSNLNFENKATPNLSAWFKAFGGGPKSSAKKKSEGVILEEKEGVSKRDKLPVAKVAGANVRAVKCMPMQKSMTPQQTIDTLGNKLPTKEDQIEQSSAKISTSPLNVTGDVRSPLLTSSESEKSPQTPQYGSGGWSAEPSPNYPDLQQRSPSALSPRHDIEKQMYGSYMDRFGNKVTPSSALKVGFYQDTSVSQKASPDKSDPTTSPYSIHSPVFPESPYSGGPKSAIVKPLAPVTNSQCSPNPDVTSNLNSQDYHSKSAFIGNENLISPFSNPVYGSDLSIRSTFPSSEKGIDKTKVGLSYPVIPSMGSLVSNTSSNHPNPVKKRTYNASPPLPFTPSVAMERGGLIDSSVVSYQNKLLKSVHGDFLKTSKGPPHIGQDKRIDMDIQLEEQVMYSQAPPNFFPSALPGNLANLSQIVNRLPTDANLLHRGTGVSVCNSSDIIKESDTGSLKQIVNKSNSDLLRNSSNKHREASPISAISSIIPSSRGKDIPSRTSSDLTKVHPSSQVEVMSPQVSSSSYLFVTHHQSPFVSQSRPGSYGQQKPCGVAERITPNLGSTYSSAFSGLSVPNIPSPALGFGHDPVIQSGLATPYTKSPFGLTPDLDKNIRAHSSTPSGSGFPANPPAVSQSPIIPQPFSGFAPLPTNSSSVIQSTYQTPRSSCDTALNMSRMAMSPSDLSRGVTDSLVQNLASMTSVGTSQGGESYQGNPPLQQGFGSSSPGINQSANSQTTNPMSPMQSNIIPSSGGSTAYDGMRSGGLHTLSGVNQSHHPAPLQFSGFTVPPVSQTQGFSSHPTLGSTLSPFTSQPATGGRAHSSLHPLMNQPLPTRQPFIPGSLMDPSSPLYQQYLHQRQQEEFLLSHTHTPGGLSAPTSMMLQQGLIGHTGFPPSYHPSLGIGQTFQGMNRPFF